MIFIYIFADQRRLSMCRISIDTVIRANKRTISQNKNKAFCVIGKSVTPQKTFNVSVSVMGKVCTRDISAKQIKDSFGKALNIHAKKL